MKNQPSFYAIIPADVRYDKRLTPNAKLLYGEITALCNMHGYCWATNSYFMNLYDKSQQTISNWIRQLKKCGYITLEIVYKPNSKEIDKRIIKLTGGIQNNFNTYTNNFVEPIQENLYTPIQENLYDNNTSNNNTSNNNKKIYKKRYLENVLLSDEEHEKLINELGIEVTNDLIERLNNYIGSKGKRYKSHYHTILTWNRKDQKSKPNQTKTDVQKKLEEWDSIKEEDMEIIG